MTPMPFGAWINRSWIDLSAPMQPGYLIPHGVDLAWRSLKEGRDLPRFDSLLLPSFRDRLQAAGARCGLAVALRHPEEVPEADRSEEWQILCDTVSRAPSLPLAELDRLLWLLHRLCLHATVDEIGKTIAYDPLSGTHEAWIAYTLRLATYALAQEEGQGDLSALFGPLVEILPIGSLPAAHASYQVAVWHAKYRPNPDKMAPALEAHRILVEAACERHPLFEAQRLRSRFHRVHAFLPQSRGDLPGMVAALDQAEAYARSVPQGGPDESLAAQEILWPLMETRIREAEALGDEALVERRARDLVAFMPSQVYAYLHLGEALADQSKIEEAADVYRRAIRLGPPCTEIALFNLGQCLEMLGRKVEAADCYNEVLALDPLAVSAAERLHELTDGDAMQLPWLTELLHVGRLALGPSQ